MKDIIKNKKSYDKAAEQYHKNLLDSKTNFWHRFIEKPAMTSILKDIVKNKTVLDLGCGSGIFTKKIFSMNANSVTGLDISGNLIEIAKKENPKIKFYVGNAAKSPFKNSQFNLVSSSLMVHYFKNLKPLFKEVSRILKKKGFFVFSMHHPIMEISGKLNVKGIKGSLLKPYFHNNKYLWTLHKKINLVSYHHTLENIINSLNDSGFVIERILEPKASEKTKKINKKMYYRTNLRPSFLIIKARKEK